MLTFREGWRSFKEGLDWRFIREYWLAVWNHAWEIFWGAGLIGVAFTIYTLYYSPPWALLGWAVALGFLVAGYAAWRSDHVRLIPKFSVMTLCPPNETDTNVPSVTNLFVQIIPECLTDAPVHGCRARLLQVSKRFEESENWRVTSMDSPLFLDWDYYGSREFTLESGIRQRLNVCRWSNQLRMIIPCVDPLPSKFRNIFNDFETFKFDIRFTATDCEPVDVSVFVSLRNRQWNNPQISLIQGI
jgi:hypothetical protein